MMKVSLAEFLGGKEADDAYNKLCELTGVKWDVERTCRVERMEIDEFGRYFYLSCGHMQMTHNTSALPYCPNCGCHVEEEA